jgi:3-hydroxybutyryl-CoA dehydratase
MSERVLSSRYADVTVGHKETTRGRTITEADLVNFCALTGDWYYLHSNAEAAAASPFGRRIAHGLLVYSYSAGLAIPPDARTLVANYGSDRIRFTAPVFIGDTIYVEIEVLSKHDKRPDGNSGVVELRWDIFKQGGVHVCASTLKVLMNNG